MIDVDVVVAHCIYTKTNQHRSLSTPDVMMLLGVYIASFVISRTLYQVYVCTSSISNSDVCVLASVCVYASPASIIGHGRHFDGQD